jgi:hypothetical protein
MFHYKYFRYYTLTNSVTLPLMYFRFNYVTVFACIFITIIVSVNEMDVFPLTDISVTVIVNGKTTDRNQSANRKGYSTETALLKVTNDVKPLICASL